MPKQSAEAYVIIIMKLIFDETLVSLYDPDKDFENIVI